MCRYVFTESTGACYHILSGVFSMQIHISVRGLVEFIMRSGDIDQRHTAQAENAMQAGSRAHREIQRSMGPGYAAEVSLSHTVPLEGYELVVEGRADGILAKESGVVVDEIKGTYRALSKIKKPVPVHLAQAKCYAYIYALQHELPEIRVRMIYCHLETEELKYFEETDSFEELSLWFDALIGEYRKWSDYQTAWLVKRNESVSGLEFPFPYRRGQKELVTYVYQTIYHKRKLFIEAPTGVGKTVSTVYPAFKALGAGRADRIFYLTAKTITRTVADDTVRLLKQKGLCAKHIVLTAKEKICPREETVCNPDACPYAKGHYDRINECLYDCLTHEDHFTREVLERYAARYRVCPFEMSLDMSLFADMVICDYNYVFDPHVYLKRFFAEGNAERYLFLIDEAHNLVERGREMYSAALYKEEFLEVKRLVKTALEEEEADKRKGRDAAPDGREGQSGGLGSSKGQDDGLGGPKERQQLYAVMRLLELCNKELLSLKRQCEDYVTEPMLGAFTLVLNRLSDAIGKYLENTDSGAAPQRQAILDFYFEISHFLFITELVDEHYIPYTQMTEDGRFLVKLFCVNPSKNLQECMGRAVSSVLFSATLLPVQYYKKLLGGDGRDYEVYAGSAFDGRKRGVYIADDVTSRYSRRGDEEYRKIAAYIRRIADCRYGNYMVFFPSYFFLQQVYGFFMEKEYDASYMDCIVQEGGMDERAREEFLLRFSRKAGADREQEDRCLIGFCVLGGMFGEGIDLKKDALIGAIIVGTGLPQVCLERMLLKEYFDADEGAGFDYAYRYPGMNKVLQAAGRVIRTVEDIGIVVLLDYRFCGPEYRCMFPREWERFEQVSLETVGKRIDRFWNEWL